mgnify:CR=1 FL=1
MKLIFCHQCQDVFKLGTKYFKSCDCGNVKARYIDSVNAEFYCENNDYSLIGFSNGSLNKSIKEYKKNKKEFGYELGENGINFDAFIIPEPCSTITKIATENSNLILKDKIQHIISEALNLPKSSISEDESLRDSCGADDLDILEITLAIDEQFGTSINNIDLLSIDTVRQFENALILELKEVSFKK